MTSIVTVVAHCSDDKVVLVENWASEVETHVAILSNGQRVELYVYGSRVITVAETTRAATHESQGVEVVSVNPAGETAPTTTEERK